MPRATSALNVLQRIGGSIGTALLAVVLQGQISDQLGARGGGDSTLERLPAEVRGAWRPRWPSAFAATFWWAVGMSVVALIPATILALMQRRERATRPTTRSASPSALAALRERRSPRMGAGRAPRAVVALVHGLGEHSGRYERLAGRFTDEGFAVTRSTCAATADSPGAAGTRASPPALEDLDELWRAAGSGGRACRCSPTATASARC